jgi:hypothetical protein
MPEQQLENEQFFRRNGEKARVRAGHDQQSYIAVRLLSTIPAKLTIQPSERAIDP